MMSLGDADREAVIRDRLAVQHANLTIFWPQDHLVVANVLVSESDETRRQ